MTRAALLVVCSCACATSAAVDANLPTGLDAWPTVAKLAYFPVQMRIDVDGAPITPESLVKVHDVVQRHLEDEVNRESLDTRTFLALAEPWQLSAVALAHWLEADPCFGSSAPADAQLATLLPPIRADAAVFIEVQANLTHDGITSGHTLVGKLAGALGVAALANVVALRAAAAGDPYVELAVESTAVQLVARDLESRRFGPLCADHVDMGLRDAPGLRLLGEASVTVAVVAADNQLLWFRRGRIPLVSGEPARTAQVMATLVRAGR